jgi:ankyrin repeat protein
LNKKSTGQKLTGFFPEKLFFQIFLFFFVNKSLKSKLADSFDNQMVRIMATMKTLIDNKDYQGIREALSENPLLANEGIPLDDKNTTKAHPLHRICDGVFANTYSDEEAVEMAKIFLEFGANVNGNELIEKRDTPLIAASSLHADKVGILYIEHGANIHHPGCHGGTALHWAAWCGRDILVKRLIQEKAEINRVCIDFRSTPLFWASHGLKYGGEMNRHHQVECIKMLLDAGADKTIPNFEGYTVFDMLDEEDIELKKLLAVSY